MTNSNQKKRSTQTRKDFLGTSGTKKGIYVIRKYIPANSAEEAIKLDKKSKVDDVWLDEESKKRIIGFI